MKKIKYLTDCVKPGDLRIITQSIPILQGFAKAGYRITLRQLHYQFVSRGILPNTDKTYKKICIAMKNGRMGGLIGWNLIEDRTRTLRSLPRWESPSDILDACADQYHVDHWKNQKCRAEVWIEKDALLGIIEKTCNHWDTPYFSCRGYSSISELHESALRIKRYNEVGQTTKILYAGDHDPSGVNMCDYITQRLKEFGADFEFERIALNMDQINQYNPPPNPIKSGDTRAKGYSKLHGNECWELDALSPQVLNDIIETAIVQCIDNMNDFDYRRQGDKDGSSQIRVVGMYFGPVHNWLKKQGVC